MVIDELYPPTPAEVPRELTAPTAAHRRHAWMAMAGLMAFVAIYLLFTGWFGWLTYRLLSNAWAAGWDGIAGWFLAIPAAFFFAFLVRGLFRVRHADDPTRIEVDAQSEPRLVAFVERIATEAGAPKPHRIFLSPRVNAAVFYDLSVLDLIFPRKKNLEIGLGLVNALTLDQMKAVIAHEFGHFAQRTMAIGRWVYVAQQVIGHVVVARDGFDRFLEGLSRVDIRIAWVGWIMRLIVWAMRAVLDTAFRGLVVLDSALSREMELQADLVSVSLCGSDSLVHALHRLQSADDAWDSAASFTSGQLKQKTAIVDFFTAQSHIERRHAEIRDDDSGLAAPAIPTAEPHGHRVFRAKLAQPPKMWSTHPPNHEREDNAKRRYIPSPLDERSAWTLFTDPARTRHEATTRLLAVVELEEEPTERLDDEATIVKIDEAFDRVCYDRSYQGAYLGRPVTRFARTADELYDPEEPGDVITKLDALYPVSLKRDLDVANDLAEQHAMLVALKEGILDVAGGVIRFRGQEYKRRQLGDLIDTVERERDEAREQLVAHDRRVRTAHRLAARQLGEGWEAYLEGLARLLHYAEHGEADIEDSFDVLVRVLNIVMADGRVTEGELTRVVATAEDSHLVVETIHGHHEQITIPPALCEALEIEDYSALLPQPFDLPMPTRQNLAEGYIGAIEAWAGAVSGSLGALRSATLELLVAAERDVAAAVRGNSPIGEAPPAPTLPVQYRSLVIGQERERQKKLGWWDAFVVADGWVPGVARFAAAVGVLGLAVGATNITTEADVFVHNGLGVPVEVKIGDQVLSIPRHGTVETLAHGDVAIQTTTADGRPIESFTTTIDNAWATYVYNVANASALVEWTAVYGSVGERPEKKRGAKRMLLSYADINFEEPPRTISTDSSKGGTRTVLAAADEANPAVQVSLVFPKERTALIAAHLRFDPEETPAFPMWIEAAGDDPELLPLVEERLETGGIAVKRAAMDGASDERRAALCANYESAANTNPDDPDALYLSIRCSSRDAPDRQSRFVAAYDRFPEHRWLALAAVDALQEVDRWQPAEAAATTAMNGIPLYGARLALEVIRMRRVQADSMEVDWTDLQQPLGSAVELLQIEKAEPARGSSLVGLSNLLRGRLRLAWNGAQDDARLAVLVAASHGATDEMRAAALTIPPEQVGQFGVLQLALGRLAQHDTGSIERALVETQPTAGRRFVDHLDVDALRARPEQTMARLTTGQSLLWRNLAYAAGVVVLGKDAPASWRHRARIGLLAHERPFFGEL